MARSKTLPIQTLGQRETPNLLVLEGERGFPAAAYRMDS